MFEAKKVESKFVVYKGRKVPRQLFRTFVYDKDNNERLVKSWDEFNDAVNSGLWFVDKNDKNDKNVKSLQQMQKLTAPAKVNNNGKKVEKAEKAKQ